MQTGSRSGRTHLTNRLAGKGTSAITIHDIRAIHHSDGGRDTRGTVKCVRPGVEVVACREVLKVLRGYTQP
jgi:hypothetical protein